MIYNVTVTMQFPTIAERNGTTYTGIEAGSRAEAIAKAKKMHNRRRSETTGAGSARWVAIPQNS